MTAAPRPIPVTVALAALTTLPIERTAVGTVVALETVDVRSRVDGYVQSLPLREGQFVNAGDVLGTLDPRSLASQVAQAQATLERDLAQLANAEAEDKRAQRLTEMGAGTSQRSEATKAQMAVLKATVQGDRAALDMAQLNLGFAEVRAPISGLVGLRRVSVGTMLQVGSPIAITTIAQVQPIAVQLFVRQDDLQALDSARKTGEVAVTVTNADGRPPAVGRLEALDNTIDNANGMMKVKVVFANDDRGLWPGQTVTARIQTGTAQDVVTVPSAAIQSGQAGPFLYVLRDDQTVTSVPVKAGYTTRDITIVQGLEAGQKVVVSGQSRLRPGIAVEPRMAKPEQSAVAARESGR